MKNSSRYYLSMWLIFDVIFNILELYREKMTDGGKLSSIENISSLCMHSDHMKYHKQYLQKIIKGYMYVWCSIIVEISFENM